MGYQGDAVGPGGGGPSFGPFGPRFTEATRLLSAATSSDIIDVTESGILVAIYMRVLIAPTGTPTARLEFVIDGETQQNLTMYSAGTTWVAGFTPFGVSGDGSSIGDRARIYLGLRYKTSCIVRANTTIAGSAGDLQFAGDRGLQI